MVCVRLASSRLLLAFAVATLVIHCLDAAPIEVTSINEAAEAEYDRSEDLGESAADAVDESETEMVGEMSDYAATKKKLEAAIKKTEDDMKKKKAAAKKHFDEQMKKTSATFAKLYAPAKKGPSPALESPLGMEGQSGISSMAQWAYATQVESYSKVAHKKIAKYEKELEENRFNHFSTAVCKEVLQSKVQAIGDLKFKGDTEKIRKELKVQKAQLAKKIAYDRADMGHKIASFKLWQNDESWAADGGMTGPDPAVTHMMAEGASHKMGASRVGELVQAAHWAFARQKAHAIDSWERNRGELQKQLKTLTEAHDLTLCRTGRKPENPQLRYQLKKAKGSLKNELQSMPADVQKAAVAKAKEKEVADAEKKVEEVKEEEKKEEKPAEEYGDLGESAETDPTESIGTEVVEFHKLIDASGGTESFAERAKMFKDLVENERIERETLAQETMGIGETSLSR